MIRLVTGGLFLLPLLGLLPGPATAATDFQDIPYLQARINQILESEPTGAEVEWRNQATGNTGVIRVLKTYFPSPDAPCRDYERTTRRPGGGESLVRGTGCRDASGRWGLKETEESGASGPERWGPPGGEATAGTPAAGGQAGQTGGQVGAQTGSGSQAQSQTEGGGQAGGLGQSQSGQTTFVLPNQGEPEPAAAQSAPETPEPAAPAPRESAPSLPEFDMPTRSD